MNSLDKIHRCAVLKIYAVSKFLAVLNTVQLLRRKSFVLLLLTAIMASKGLFKLGKALMFGKTESALAVSLKSVIHGLVIVCIAWQWYRNGSHAKKVQRRAKLSFLPFYLLLNTILF